MKVLRNQEQPNLRLQWLNLSSWLYLQTVGKMQQRK